MGVRQRPSTRTATAAAWLRASSSPSNTTPSTPLHHQQPQQQSPLSPLDLEHEMSAAEQQRLSSGRKAQQQQQAPPHRSSSNSKSDSAAMTSPRVNNIMRTMTSPPRKRGIKQQSSSYLPSSLLAIFIFMASGFFFFNLIMVFLAPTTNNEDTQQRRSVLWSNSQLRRGNNNLHARIVYSIQHDEEDNEPYSWSIIPPRQGRKTSRRRTVDDEFMRVSESLQPIPSNSTTSDDNNDENSEDECIPMADWQTASYPNCNIFHEIDLPTAIDAGAIRNDETSTTITPKSSASEDVFKVLAEGWFRTTWQWNRRHIPSTLEPMTSSHSNLTSTMDKEEESVVIKTLRIERDFFWEYYDLHNRDAVAMERLTHSPYVVDVYAYCGQSAINERADFPVPEMTYLEKMNRRLRGYNDHRTSILKLHVAARIATGLAHVHAAGQAITSTGQPPRPSMVHYDLNPKNVAIFRGGRPKINDFNIAEFLRYNPKTNETCGFKSRMHGPWWRAPEEMELNKTVYLDEKVDIYSLGQTLFHLLTSKAPRGQMLASREQEVRELVRNGKRPGLMLPFTTSNDTVFVAFRKVFDLCHQPDPKQRGTAQQVADILWQAMDAEREIMRQQAANGHLDNNSAAAAAAAAPPLLALGAAKPNNTENDDETDFEQKQ